MSETILHLDGEGRPIESGEALDIENFPTLLAYLLRQGHIRAEETPRSRLLAGGVSNRVVIVERPNGEAFVLKQALEKLRVAADWRSDPSRIQREALALRWLERLMPPGVVMPLLWEDKTHHVLAMRAAPAPHDNWKTMLLAGRIVEQKHARQFGQMLGRLHGAAYERRDELQAIFADTTFFEELRLRPFYEHAAARRPEAAAFSRALAEETRLMRLTLTHGDYSPKNILVHRGRLILLDHEVVHFGDPAFDVGFALAHLLGKANHLWTLRPVFARAARQFWSAYRASLGARPLIDGLEARAARHTLGCLLARVDGKSPLEYLDEPARARQRAAALSLMARPPKTISVLVRLFLSSIA
jgi:5-methylthioribose kinase